MIEKEIVNTPLKIQGKKTKLIPNIIGLANEIIENNNNNIHTWIEPFLGSGIVAFNCPKQIKQVICGDINPYVIRLYEMLRDNKDLPDYARERLLCMSDLLKDGGEEYYLSVRNSFNKDKSIDGKRNCLTCGKLFKPYEIHTDKQGIHPAGKN